MTIQEMQKAAQDLGLSLVYDIKASSAGAMDRLTIRRAAPDNFPAGMAPASLEQIVGSTGAVRTLTEANVMAMLHKARVQLGLAEVTP